MVNRFGINVINIMVQIFGAGVFLSEWADYHSLV
jgi:hypothetical protein